MGRHLSDSEKAERVDRWLDDVSAASRRWKTAKAAQQSAERIVAYLDEISEKMRGCAPPDLEARMEEAKARNCANVAAAVDEAARQAEIESSFYEVVKAVKPPEVAEAWRMRCIDHKTWLQCSLAVRYNRQHLERLSKAAKVDVYGMIPKEYRHGE